MKFPRVITILLFVGVFLTGCEAEPEKTLYPWTEHGIEYLGLSTKVDILSTDSEFLDSLTEILQIYISTSQYNPSNEFIFDGITYEFTNLQTITGGVPKSVWDIFWEDLDKYSYSVGSCWGFAHGQIPTKGGTGIAYVLYTIVTARSEVLYIAVKGNVSPKK